MVAKKEDDKKSGFALGRENYKLMAIGFAIIIVGFILMAGGRSDDPRVFSEDIFSFIGAALGGGWLMRDVLSVKQQIMAVSAAIVLAGFVFEIYAIMKRPRE